MTTEVVPVVLHILDKEYRIACPEEEREALLAAVRYLNRQIKEIRDGGRVIGAERIAVMAALNITHELLQHRAQKDRQGQALSARLQGLQERIDRTLDRANQKDL